MPVPGDDIDTDRIIPARFMKCVTFDGLGDYMFYDVRKNEDGSNRDHPLNDERFAGATILISGSNFGCGSSREHAPQAIYRAGFRGVIAEGFAEIFLGNSTQLGMPCVTVSREDRIAMMQRVKADPSVAVTIDLDELKVRMGEQTFDCAMREGNRHSLLGGRWDPLEDLLAGSEQVEAVAGDLSYMKG